ncbi:MAG: divalent-cation tolerance protein CutA [Candidatus Omnitrophota bacterium]
MYIVAFVTCASFEEAQKIASGLVEKKLVACVNIIDKVSSLFWWDGKVDRAQEVLLIMKSKRTKMNQIIKTVKSGHSYKVPEIIALPIIAGYKPYLEWIDAAVRDTV